MSPLPSLVYASPLLLAHPLNLPLLNVPQYESSASLKSLSLTGDADFCGSGKIPVSFDYDKDSKAAKDLLALLEQLEQLGLTALLVLLVVLELLEQPVLLDLLVLLDLVEVEQLV